MKDCLLIGHNDGNFADHVDLVSSWGTDSVLWRKLNLCFVEVDGVPLNAMDVINRSNGLDGLRLPKLSNMDVLWPAVSYLASYLARRGFTVEWVNLFQEEKSELAAKLRREDVGAVAVTTTLCLAPWPIQEVVAFVRQHNRSARIVVGGPYIVNEAATLSPSELAALFVELGADVYVISQEGELALARVLDAMRHGRPLADIDNIAYLENGGFVRTKTSAESNPLAENPVDYDLFSPERVGDCVLVRTVKSCPFACSFCSFPVQGGSYVYEDVEAVEAELDRLRRVGTVQAISFVDDTFNVPEGRFKQLMRMMIRNAYPFRWSANLRADHLDAESIDLLCRSGCEGVFLGVESGSETVLKIMNKSARPEHYRRLIPRLKDAGILTHCSLFIGFPGETRETVEETAAFLEDLQPDTFQAHPWFCNRATPIWNRREEFGLRGSGFAWEHRTMDVSTAIEIMEEWFLTVRGPVWLPQQGFSSWSIFYLQRRGMPLAQTMRFMRDFNDAIRFKLRHGKGQWIEPGLLDAVNASGRF